MYIDKILLPLLRRFTVCCTFINYHKHYLNALLFLETKRQLKNIELSFFWYIKIKESNKESHQWEKDEIWYYDWIFFPLCNLYDITLPCYINVIYRHWYWKDKPLSAEQQYTIYHGMINKTQSVRKCIYEILQNSPYKATQQTNKCTLKQWN